VDTVNPEAGTWAVTLALLTEVYDVVLGTPATVTGGGTASDVVPVSLNFPVTVKAALAPPAMFVRVQVV
jgi:hypothetical protein